MEPRFINPPELSSSPSYSHVVVTPAGRTVHVSGQVALDASGNVVGAGDLRAQAGKVYENLKAALASAETNLGHVIKIVTYVVDLTPDKAAVVREVRTAHMPKGHRPASTMVGVTSLVTPDLLIEVEAIAFLPDRR